jgi:hypothetical protein
MQRALLAIFVLVLLAADWVAVHDILKGEPDTTGEYLVVGFSGVVFGVLLGLWRRSRRG